MSNSAVHVAKTTTYARIKTQDSFKRIEMGNLGRSGFLLA